MTSAELRRAAWLRTEETTLVVEGNGDLLARVVQLIAEVQATNRRLDTYILEMDAWRRETDAWRREITDNMKTAALSLHAASHVLQDLDRRVSALEEKQIEP